MKVTIEQLTKYFEFLDGLRESGATNMFGAGEWLVEEFSLNKIDARTVLLAWMKTFGDGKNDCHTRAKNYLQNEGKKS